MNKRCPEIIAIRSEIETSLERRIKSPSDFDFLSEVVWERLGECISPTTLKRIWGYIDGAQTIRYSTLTILAKFVGYKDWESFCDTLAERSDIESQFVVSHAIDARKMRIGDCIEVSWAPNRHCIFRHTGQCGFEVVEAQNSKLKVGDSFQAVFFVEGEPLYLDNLRQGDNAPTSYMCGNKKGLSMVEVL